MFDQLIYGKLIYVIILCVYIICGEAVGSAVERALNELSGTALAQPQPTTVLSRGCSVPALESLVTSGAPLVALRRPCKPHWR